MKPNLLKLDLETYYDNDLNLRKLTIQEYIYDPRFHVHGLAIGYPDAKTEFRTDVEQAIKELQQQYGQHLEKVMVVMHNAYFDYAVLHWKYGLKIYNIFDTMLASYHVYGHAGEGGERASLEALANKFNLTAKGDLSFMRGVWTPDALQLERLREYATNDVNITGQIAEKLLPMITNPQIELPIIAHTVRMFVERAYTIDTPTLDMTIEFVRNRIESGLKELNVTEEDISRNKTFIALLTKAMAITGRSIPMKEGKKGLIPAVAKTDHEMELLANDEDPVVQQLACLRLHKKSADQTLARLEYLKRVAELRDGKVSFQIVYHKARTGRFAGGGGFNIQNIPVAKRAKTADGKYIAESMRKSITAPPGQVIVAVDAAQIEARILAWVAGQTDLVESFAAKKNVYCEFGTSCLGREVKKPKEGDSSEAHAFYNISKQAVLGLGYGMGVSRFVASLKIDSSAKAMFNTGALNDSVCSRIVYGYRDRYQNIKKLWTDCDKAFRDAIAGVTTQVGPVSFSKDDNNVIIQLPSSRVIRYPNARLEHNQRSIAYVKRDGFADNFTSDEPEIVYAKETRIYGGKIVENITQAIARDILVEAILKLERMGWPVYAHVHDELLMVVNEKEGEDCKKVVIETLSTAPVWAPGLPLSAEGHISKTL